MLQNRVQTITFLLSKRFVVLLKTMFYTYENNYLPKKKKNEENNDCSGVKKEKIEIFF